MQVRYYYLQLKIGNTYLFNREGVFCDNIFQGFLKCFCERFVFEVEFEVVLLNLLSCSGRKKTINFEN